MGTVGSVVRKPSCRSAVTAHSSGWQYGAQWFPAICTAFEATGWQVICIDADVKQAVSPPLYRHLTPIYFSAGYSQALVPRGRCLNVICDNVEVWCVPSAANVSSVPRSQNKGFSIRVLPYLLQHHSVVKYSCIFVCSEQCWLQLHSPGVSYLLFSFTCVFYVF